MVDAVFDAEFLASVPRFLTPLLLAGLGGALCERAGVFNIALEGMMLTGAFAAVTAAFLAGSPYAGALAAAAAGAAMGAVFGVFHLRRGGDPIVVSIAINLLAAGLTAFLLRRIFGVSGSFEGAGVAGFAPVRIALAEDIPLVGPVLAGQSPLFYLACLGVPALQLLFARHRLGLRLRAAGDNPAGLAAAGVKVARVRMIALVVCGVLCGLAGAQLSIANVSLFVENMSAGRGFIAVVAVLLTRGRPWPLMGVTVLFGAVDSLSSRLQGLGMPQQFTDMMPYLATLAVLTLMSSRLRRTAADPA